MNMNTLMSLNNVAEINELVTLQSLTCLRKDCFFCDSQVSMWMLSSDS